MNFFCILAIYFISNLNSWMMSALFFSFAISMKASAIFYMPAFLGTV
jgi:Gpi18-like mannosyltransferase